MKLPKVTQHVMQETRVELKMFPSLMVFPQVMVPASPERMPMLRSLLGIKNVQIFQHFVFFASVKYPDYCPLIMLPFANAP